MPAVKKLTSSVKVKKMTDERTKRISFDVKRDDYLFLKSYSFDKGISIRDIMVESIKSLKSKQHGK